MTPEQILELAHSAGVYVSVIDKPRPYLDKHGLLNLAKLIEAATREECAKRLSRTCIQMTLASRTPSSTTTASRCWLKRFGVEYDHHKRHRQRVSCSSPV